MHTCNVTAPPSSSRVTIVTADNATFQDAFQFDDEDDVSWSFSNKEFRMDIKRDAEDAAALLTFTDGAGEIVVDNVTTRVLHFNVARETIQAAAVPGAYVYDLLMTDGLSAVVTQLMHGEFILTDGVTGV